MTDEEMAEQYVKENGKVYYHSNGEPIFTREEDLKFAFLAGLKAGKPEWHKVADGDLPKENKLYLVAIKDNGLAIAYFNGRHWETKFNLGDFGHLVETVIAWCEIPTFDKE